MDSPRALMAVGVLSLAGAIVATLIADAPFHTVMLAFAGGALFGQGYQIWDAAND